jgi:hypothetical protein
MNYLLKVLSVVCVFMLMSQPIKAQDANQTIRGIVTDKISNSGIPGVSIVIIGTDPLIGAKSDTNGNFILRNVPVGRYDIKATYMGFKEVLLPNILVTSGKEVGLEIEMEEQLKSYSNIVVKGNKERKPNNEMSVISSRSFSMEEVNRYSGGLGDPARLAANFAGVVTPNDQRNDLVIRGNTPAGVLWRVDGLNVPNLNHFAVMGSNGGPVSALNTNVLKNSDFMTAAFAPEYGNALSGVFDINFRKGNADKREHTFQFGAFTGLEFMTEGPFKKESGASYMIAYRYSFTGIAQAVGLNIGTAATPNYQDLTFKLTTGKTKWGTFSLFGLGGKSDINFLHNKIDTSDVFADPSRDSYSKSTLGLLGVSHQIQITKNSFLKTVVGANYSENGFDQDTLDVTNKNPGRSIELSTKVVHYTLNTAYNMKVNTRFNFKIGAIAEIMVLNLKFNDRDGKPDWAKIWDFAGNTALFQVYAQSKYAITDKVSLIGGLHAQQLTLNGSRSLEPRLAVKYQISNKSTFTLGYGWHEQMQPLTVYFYQLRNPDGTYNTANENLGFSRSQHIVLGYDFLPTNDWRIKTEVYAQYLSKIPVTSYSSSFSLLNEGASFIPTQQGNLQSTGTGINYGIEATIEKFFTKGYYGLLTASVYSARYYGSDLIMRNTAFNGKYTINFLAGKEFKVGKSRRNVITADTKFTSAGGRYFTPVDLPASQAIQKEVLKGDAYAFTEQYPNYYRYDVKFGFRLNSKTRKLSQTFSIDLQNVTNQKNIFARQYNRVTNQINTTYQNGFLPNFVYKLQF